MITNMTNSTEPEVVMVRELRYQEGMNVLGKCFNVISEVVRELCYQDGMNVLGKCFHGISEVVREMRYEEGMNVLGVTMVTD